MQGLVFTLDAARFDQPASADCPAFCTPAVRTCAKFYVRPAWRDSAWPARVLSGLVWKFGI